MKRKNRKGIAAEVDSDGFTVGAMLVKRLGKSKKKTMGKRLQRNAQLEDMIADEVPATSKETKIKMSGIKEGWHRVTCPYAAKYPKELVLSTLANALLQKGHSFEPICFKQQGQSYSFFVETPTCAMAIKSLDKKLNVNPRDAFILKLIVISCPAPQMTMTDDAIDAVKASMSRRYLAIEKRLDLSHFYCDEGLSREFYVPLARSSVMNKVIKIINENAPDVVSIDLSKNKLPTLDHFSSLQTPQLQELKLSQNRLASLSQLQKLSSLNLQSLWLDDNPIMTNLPKGQNIQDAVAKLLPSLKILNGVCMSVGQHEEDLALNLPTARRESLPSQQYMVDRLLTFIKAYFHAYDSDSRQQLLEAYHEQVYFSMTAVYPPNMCVIGVANLGHYLCEARNLKLVSKSAKRNALLKKDRNIVLSVLSELPRTKHNLDSFTLDVYMITDQLVDFTLTGLFKEKKVDAAEPVRYFNRKMLVLAKGTSFQIVNELYTVTIATPIQAQDFQKWEHAANEPLSEAMQAMVISISQSTGMNYVWSRKCLEDTNWSVEAALESFQSLMTNSIIPQEAFQK